MNLLRLQHKTLHSYTTRRHARQYMLIVACPQLSQLLKVCYLLHMELEIDNLVQIVHFENMVHNHMFELFEILVGMVLRMDKSRIVSFEKDRLRLVAHAVQLELLEP
jgi:hypothetical protein